ncbi:MAG: alanine racemase [Oscillospiraceae bacterium]|nr:alanine racemase [Oscillospiraceae bacterium]
MKRNNYVKINTDAILANYRAVCEKTGVPVMAIIKADAYGHGAVQVAHLLEQECPFFGVSSVSEALELRQAHISQPILILGHTPPSVFHLLVGQGIRPTIFSLEDAAELNRLAAEKGITAPCHIAVDTGMSRIGFQVTEEDADICAQIAKLSNVEIEGIFSHFATADCEDLSRSHTQAALFDRFCGMLRSRGVVPKMYHLNNSAGIMNFDTHYDIVRSGIVTYGLYPSDEVSPALLPLIPAMSWYSRVSHVKTLPAGREISYGGTYVTTAPTRIATIPVGYADGYRRSLSGKFYVLLHGKKAPILGRVCMDQMMVDVTDIPEAAVGDTVTLIGTDGDETITMEQIADAAGSFNYEFACGISRRVCRRYTSGGKVILEVDFLLDK